LTRRNSVAQLQISFLETYPWNKNECNCPCCLLARNITIQKIIVIVYWILFQYSLPVLKIYIHITYTILEVYIGNIYILYWSFYHIYYILIHFKTLEIIDSNSNNNLILNTYDKIILANKKIRFCWFIWTYKLKL